MQTDPVGYADQMNLYAYVHNDPMNNVDPTGRTTTAVGAGIGCAATGPGCPVGAVVGAVIGTVAGIVIADAAIDYFSESAETENKGQTKPEVGDCPDCGGKTSNKPGKIGKEHGLKPKEVKDKIHGLKGDANISGNPDVEVCNDCGEVFPQTESGGLGDSIGNIDEDP